MKLALLDSWQILLPSINWLWLFLLSCFASVVICFGAYRKLVILAGKTKRYFIYVSLINVCVMLLLFALVLPIEKIKAVQQRVVLLTSGVSQQQVDSLKLDNIATVYLLAENDRLKDVELERINEKLIKINAIEQLPLSNKTMVALSIYGDGLVGKQLELLTNVSIDFFPSFKLSGLIDVNWRKEITLGQGLIVQGKFQQGNSLLVSRNTDNKQGNNIVEVALFDPFDKKIASNRVKANETFSLRAQPKTPGKFIYKVKVIDNSDQVISEEPVATYVKNTAVAKLLIKQSAPSFETKQLKNWAVKQGAMVVVQTQISKDKLISQQVNVSADNHLSNTENFDSAFLNHFDLLVIDGRGLLSLKEHEIKALHAAIKKGLGLYVIADPSLISAFSEKGIEKEPVLAMRLLLNDFTLLSNEPTTPLITSRQASQLYWLNGFTQSPIKLIQGQLSVKKGLVLVRGPQQQAVVSSKSRGLGYVSVSLFNHSYRLITQEKALVYSQLWQYLFEKISRNAQQAYWLTMADDNIYRVGEQSLQCALAASNKSALPSEQQSLSSPQLSLTANIANKHQYCGFIWPDKRGWQLVDLKDSGHNVTDQRWLFGYEHLDWLVWQQAIKHDATVQAAQLILPSKMVVTSAPIDKKFIWLLLFIGLTVLWLEHKNRD